MRLTREAIRKDIRIRSCSCSKISIAMSERATRRPRARSPHLRPATKRWCCAMRFLGARGRGGGLDSREREASHQRIGIAGLILRLIRSSPLPAHANVRSFAARGPLRVTAHNNNGFAGNGACPLRRAKPGLYLKRKASGTKNPGPRGARIGGLAAKHELEDELQAQLEDAWVVCAIRAQETDGQARWVVRRVVRSYVAPKGVVAGVY
jgi:hypothetical protein